MTVGAGNGSVVSTGITTRTGTGTYNGAASSSSSSAAAPSSRFSSTTNNTETTPAYTVRDNGWIHIPNVRLSKLLCSDM
jgi:hypothetical protein